MERQEPRKQTSQSVKNTPPVIPYVRRSTRRKEENQKTKVKIDQITTMDPIAMHDSKMKMQKEKLPVKQATHIEAIIRRTPPHLLNEHKRKHMDQSTSIRHPGGSSTNPTRTSSENCECFGFLPRSFSGSSLLPEDHITDAPQQGQTRKYIYSPMLSSSTPKTSAPSSSVNTAGTPSAHDNPSEQLLGGSNLRAASHQLPHQLSSFYPAVCQTDGNNWNQLTTSSVLPTQCHWNQLGRQKQQPLPAYWSSQNTNNITDNANTRLLTSSSTLGKRPAASNPAHSFLQLLLPPPPLDADDTVLVRGPQCKLAGDELLSLLQSLGTPEFLANSEKVLRSGSSLHEPSHAAAAHVPVRSSSTVSQPGLLLEVLGSGRSLYWPYHAAAAAHVPVSSSAVSSEPSLLLGLGNGNATDKGKGKEVCSYWDLSAMVETMKSMKKPRHERSRPLPVKTLSLDGQGCSKEDTMQHRP